VVPDWRDASQYEFVRDLSHRAVAWEFLRRNPEYRKGWLDYKDLQQRAFADLKAQDSDRLTDTVLEWTREVCVHRTSRRWCLAQWESPDDSPIEPVFVFPYRFNVMASVRKQRGLVLHTKEAGIFRFDINRPINPQVERVRRELLRLQAEVKGKGAPVKRAYKVERALKEAPVLLRILDAGDAYSFEVHDVLFPDNTERGYEAMMKHISKKRKQAERIMQTDYMLIAENSPE